MIAAIIMTAFLGIALVLHFAAAIAYGPRIQRYLESVGESPTFFGFNWALHQDYLRARRIAKRGGHRLEFMRRFELVEIIACLLIVCGLLVAIISEVGGYF